MMFFTRYGWTFVLATLMAIGVVCGGEDNGANAGDAVSVIDPNTVIRSTFTDGRDGQTYNTVKIGNQTWMAKNLNIETGVNWCYEDDDSKCNEYGRLYNWETATTACPSGWHLPTEREWTILCQSVGGQEFFANQGEHGWAYAGQKLKSKSGWVGYNGQVGNGTDNYGFSAKPGSSRMSYDGSFCCSGDGYWWTATTTEWNTARAYSMNLDYQSNSALELGKEKSDGLSVRCLRNGN